MSNTRSSDDNFDPYHRWLGLPEGRGKPTHYKLLGIAREEHSEEIINSAADRQANHIRSFVDGDHGEAARRILYEIEEAKFCVLSPELRRQYDAKLREKRRKRRKKRRVVSVLVSPDALADGPVVGEESGLARDYFRIVSILFVAFLGMAAASFYLPWREVIFDHGDGVDEPVSHVDPDDRTTPSQTAGTDSVSSPQTSRPDGVGSEATVPVTSSTAAIPPEESVGLLRVFKGHQRPVFALAFSSDSSMAYSGGADNAVIAWTTQDGEERWKKSDFPDRICSIAISTDGQTLYVCYQTGIQYLEAATGRVTKTVSFPIKANRVALSSEARRILLIPTGQSGDAPAVLFDPNESRVVRKFQRPPGVSHGTISADGQTVVCGEYVLDVHNLASGRNQEGLIRQWGYFDGMDISPDGRLLATGSGGLWADNRSQIGNRLVRVWDIETGNEIAHLEGHRAWVKSVIFTPNSRMVLSAGGGTPEDFGGFKPTSDNSLRLWNIADRTMVWEGKGHPAVVYALAASEDGKYALSGGEDQTVRLWRLPAIATEKPTTTPNRPASQMITKLEKPKPRGDEVIVLKTQQQHWRENKTNYVRINGDRFELGMGNDHDGFGVVTAGWQLQNIRSVIVNAEFFGTPKTLDENTFVGLMVDYKTGEEFTKRIGLTPMSSTHKRWGPTPGFWGTKKPPERIERLNMSGGNRGGLKTIRVDVGKWAPSQWSGEVWVSLVVQNTGLNTGWRGTIQFTPPD